MSRKCALLLSFEYRFEDFCIKRLESTYVASHSLKPCEHDNVDENQGDGLLLFDQKKKSLLSENGKMLIFSLLFVDVFANRYVDRAR